MGIEGVMISYNYSNDSEQAKILTVAASGIKFSKRWVLTHGSILLPLEQAKYIQNARGKPILNDDFYNNLPEMFVTCEANDTKSDIYSEIANISRDRNSAKHPEIEHSSYLIRVFTGRICHVWQCPVLSRCVDDVLYSWTVGYLGDDVHKQPDVGKAMFSVFVLIDLETDDRALKTLRPLSELLDIVRPPPERGNTIELQSTPFGCEVFLNSVSRGSICGVVGKRPSLLLTDAATALGCEGGPVFTEGSTKELIGIIVCSVSWCRGEWVGLTLVAPLVSVLGAKLRVAHTRVPRIQIKTRHREILDRIDTTTVFVRCGMSWGTGVYLGGGHVLTCAHVVSHFATSKISVYCCGVKETAIVRYKAPDNQAYDLAMLYTNPEHWKHLTPAAFSLTPATRGESVLATGFPYFCENDLNDLRPTVTSGHINNVSPSMLQISCCIQAGFSGGPVFRMNNHAARVEVLGIVASTAKTHLGSCYPYVSMAIPSIAFIHMIRTFVATKDINELKGIENKKEMVQSQWKLRPYKSKI